MNVTREECKVSWGCEAMRSWGESSSSLSNEDTGSDGNGSRTGTARKRLKRNHVSTTNLFILAWRPYSKVHILAQCDALRRDSLAIRRRHARHQVMSIVFKKDLDEDR
ncbi:hypothetical protein DKX38_014809 [Salix brachista]|uniref:Uncharacterized protein n=1 Tax=Salix brachista TaxID=2182728 RepID=A0A5N5LG84_9ROSI|nr:hypothetical protein DKX38_014809 [Salix brachista]